jgi:hypothetical protein
MLFEANGDFTHPEEHTEKRILHQKDACKFNTTKRVNGEALPGLDAIVLLEDYGTAASIAPQQNPTMRT